MPPKVRFDRKQVLSAAFDLTREEGIDALNARAVAKRLGCSTQPLFRVFSSMEEIRAQVISMAEQSYIQTVRACEMLDMPPYKKSGMAYLHFAHAEPQLFILLFMQKKDAAQPPTPFTDVIMEPVITTICTATGYDRELALRLHRHVWFFTHGLASMVATHTLPYDEKTSSELLTECYLAARSMYDAIHTAKKTAT